MIENRQISMSDIFCEQAEEQRKKRFADGNRKAMANISDIPK